MPELPEVESTRRHIAGGIIGRTVAEAMVRRPRTARHNLRPADVVERLTGQTVDAVDRRGKFLMTTVSGDLTMVIHLGMSGRLRLTGSAEPLDAHTNFVARFTDGTELRFVDPRTFGFVAVYTDEELAASSLSQLGPDALDALPTSTRLRQRLEGRSAPIKALLLDQRLMAGLGNIYADEVLFRAGVRPTRPAGRLTPAEVAALRRAIRPVLLAGIAAGGTSLDDLAYLLPDGRAGDYLARLRVYGREGEPCRRCRTPIERVIVAQRSSHFCPRCQT
jgi:formamidopyrimidine-DNA glycosylase